MKIVTEFPREVREIENVFIPTSDGTRLAARIWIPADAEESKVPAILEYIPYRKRDRMRERDEPMHRYFAGHGYAAVRVDVRGTGDSDGVLLDEYHPQEIDDAVEVIEWLAAQSWCTGAVGMMGKSWGGFNALQVAARRPAPLRAVLSVCASDDRYSDDAHYMGGCLLNENLAWGSGLLTLAALPPDPEIRGGEWRELWRMRLESLPLFPEIWMRHPTRDAYWRQGSVCQDYEAIACPVYAIGGWADAYTDTVPRLLENLRVPRKGLVGPWAHVYPHNGVPRPAIGFLQEALRWWERWLYGRDNGIMDEPSYRVWMPEPVAPEARAIEVPGRWVAEKSWPSPEIREKTYFLAGEGRLSENAPEDRASRELASPLHTGLSSGSWCPFGSPHEMPRDQAADDALSLVFDGPLLEERLEILGAAELRLRLRSDEPDAMIAARLEDVSPRGVSTRVSYAVLDLTHRESHERPELLPAGREIELRLALRHAAYAFLPGHRIRLALSTSYWPIAWPKPERFTLSIRCDGSRILLPVRTPRADDELLPPFDPPESAATARTTEIQKGIARETVDRDEAAGTTLYRVSSDATEDEQPALTRIEATRVEHGHAVVETYRITEPDPLSARAEILHDARLRRDGWSVRVHSTARLAASREEFLLEAEIEAFENGKSVFLRRWSRAVPRWTTSS